MIFPNFFEQYIIAIWATITCRRTKTLCHK